MDTLLSSVQHYAGILKGKAFGVIDAVFPPEKRAEVVAKLQSFAINNPKLAFFLLTNVVLTGIPLGLFVLFSLTVFVFALVVALLVAVLAAVLFTVGMLGVALIIVLPTVFFTTLTACFITCWGLGGYYILRWFNEGETPGAPGSTIGEKLSGLVGGRLDGVMDAARENLNAQRWGIGTGSGDTTTNGKQGKGEKGDKGESDGGNGNAATAKTTGAVTDGAQNVQKTASGATQGGPKKLNTAAGTVKGAAGGATGLV